VRTWWARLSLEEQTACIGDKSSYHIGSYVSYLPKGPLEKLWIEQIFPIMQSILRQEDANFWFGFRRRALAVFGLVLLGETTGSPIPAILVISESRKVAQAVISVIRKDQKFSSLNLGFTFVVNNLIVTLT
jgi:hypothetical protein